MGFTATQSFQFSNISATTAQFNVKGGKYGATVTATGFGTQVQLQTLSLDGTTWLNVGTNFTANGLQTYDLPPGPYRVVIAGGATGVFFALTSIPT